MNITIVGTAYPLRGGIAHYNALLGGSQRHTVTPSHSSGNILRSCSRKTQQETRNEHGPPPRNRRFHQPVQLVYVGRMIATGV
jgi:hypothetical protein